MSGPFKLETAKSLRLHGSVARDLGLAIVSGDVPPGRLLEGEIEASRRLRISRTAYREAVRILAAKGLVVARPKIGTRVSAPEAWHLLDPDVLEWVFSGDPNPSVLRALFELRSIIEPEAAALAATRRLRQHLDAMSDALAQMRSHGLRDDIGRAADKAFHAALFAATGNPFIYSLANSVTAAIHALNEFKQRDRPLKRDVVPDHERVYEAIRKKDAQEAQRAMSELIRLAVLDTPMQQRGKRSKAAS